MEGEIFPHSLGYEVEFGKRLRIMKVMLAHMESQRQLLLGLMHEESIPESARGMAKGAIEEDLSSNKNIFNDFLIDFISYGMQGLHRMDVDLQFTYISSAQPKIECCAINIDGVVHVLPPDIGSRLVDNIVRMCVVDEGHFPEQFIELYKRIEGYYDLLLGADLDRCSLLLTEELFPSSCYHLTLRLPAHVLMEQDLNRWADS